MPGESTFVAFLRAVNVGGTGKLPMSTLKALCEDLGFSGVKTYIASGNVVFTSTENKKYIKQALEAQLLATTGKEVGVIIRTAAEIKKVLSQNPFPDSKPNYTVALLLEKKPGHDALDSVTGQADEELVLGLREIYIHYPSGMGRSKLKLLAQKMGTARNINTIKKMVEMSS